jgi:PAS domain S-box-containing protein
MAARHSLRVRLPLLITALLITVVTTFLWAAYREVEATLARAGGDRASGAASQVASLFEVSSGAENLRRAAADAAVRRYVQDPTATTADAARTRLVPLASGGNRRIELWSAAGSRLLDASTPAGPIGDEPPIGLPAVTHLPALGLNPLQAVDNVVFTDSAAEILAESRSAGEAGARLGYVVVRSTFSINPPGALGQLVGADAKVLIGNSAGGTWTDMSSVVAAPPVDLTRNGMAEYRAANGEGRLGALAKIRGTPWAVWVEFPRAAVVAPARVFLRRMSLVALLFVAIGAVLAGNLSVRITRPLHELAEAAREIAVGDYSRTVTAPRRDEIGLLGHAFNAMVADVNDGHQQLEARVTERTRALEALRASETHYRSLVEVALDCVITIDAAGKVVEFNPAAEKTFGYQKRDVAGRELAALIVPPAQRDAHRRGLARYVATGKSQMMGRRIELTAMRSDGTEFPVELAICAVPSDTSPMLTAVARDLTEQKRMEQSRQKTQSLEEQHSRMLIANRLKSEFLANMSHELRTPLNAIIGFAELMHRGKVGPVSAVHKEYLGDILASSQHLLQLINDVLDLTKVESGKMEFRPERVDLATLVDAVRDTLRVLSANQGLQIETEIDPESTAAVVDPARVKQILFNYLSNAIKFTPPGGRVLVRISAEGPDMVRLDVEDTGVGIPADQLQKLFVEFEQLDSGTTKQHQGTGLGLALSKRLVEAQGGRVAVRSTPGKGSTFSAILPRMMTMATEAEVRPVVGQRSCNRTILVVDNDRSTLKLADVALRESGFQTVCKDNGADALLAAQVQPPAAVIVDLLMPRMDGFEFISRLRAFSAGPHIPILVWTVKDLDVGERLRLLASTTSIVSKRMGGSQALVEEVERLLSAMSIVPERTDVA